MSEDKFFASEISHSAEEAEQSLLAILKTADLQANCYAYKSRVKSWKNLLSKVELKRKKKPEYCLSDITDVLGLRIVTLFRQDMIDIIDIILSLISHQVEYNPVPFEKDGLVEAIIYTPSPKNDNIISQAEQKIHSFNLLPSKDITIESTAARYSSIHLVAYMDFSVPDFNNTYKIPVEIQIRTVFEDAWGELDHKFGYQDREGKSDKIIQNPIHVQKNLLTMKRFVDSCSEYADNIRDLATESQMETRTIKPLETDELTTKNLLSEGVPQQIISEYMKVREIRASAEESKNTSQTYLNAAVNFKELLEQTMLNSTFQESEGFSAYYYYIKMDEALCRLSTSDISEVEKALTIYLDLTTTYTFYPVVKFRLGQALIRLKEYDEARKQLKKCRTMVRRLSKFPEETRAIRLPDVELKRIQIRLYLLLGFAYWKESSDIYKTNPESARVKTFLKQAFAQTEPALTTENISKADKIKLINNMAFYALEIVYFKASHFNKGNGNLKEYSDFINNNISVMEDNTNLKTAKNISHLDTLMNCYIYLDNKPKALTVAKRLEKLSLELNLAGHSIDKDILERVTAILNE
jgi:ppGpp synthetase/RelA/SpoT-type nucleotidyltranferase